MNREDVTRWARQVGYPIQHSEWQKATEEFAALVAAHVREAEFKPDWNTYQQGLADGAAAENEMCAKVCETHGSMARHAVWMAEECAALIRARGQ